MDYRKKLKKSLKSINAAFLPPPDMTVSEHADKYMILGNDSSNSGAWKTIGYQKAIMDAFCCNRISQVVCLKSSRVGWTKIINNVIAYYVHYDPCSILVVQPTIEDAEGYSKEEITGMIDNVPVIGERMGTGERTKHGNTIRKKKYPGGMLHIIGSNSPRGFRRITVRIVLFDEIDGYPISAGKEGDQIKLGIKRSDTFWNRKVGMGSTPTDKGISKIENEFYKETTDKGYYLLKCPHCGVRHYRTFREPEKKLVIRGKEVPNSFISLYDDIPKWYCASCEKTIEYKHNSKMIENGIWRAEKWSWNREKGFSFKEGFSGKVGFRIWSGYSIFPNSTPQALYDEFLSCKNDTTQLKTFVNTVLGEAWEEEGEEVSFELISGRAEDYGEYDVPEKDVVLTCGVDIQADRIELEVVAWKKGFENWSIDYSIIPGDTSQEEVYDKLDDYLNGEFSSPSGKLPISSIVVDSGYRTNYVYQYVISQNRDYLYAGKGISGKRPVIESVSARIRRLNSIKRRSDGKVKPEMIGVDEAKEIIYMSLSKSEAGDWYCHFPLTYDEEYYSQMCAEKKVTRYRAGRPYVEWIKVQPRNEVLDCRVMAYAALLLHLGSNKGFSSRKSKSLENASLKIGDGKSKVRSGGFLDW